MSAPMSKLTIEQLETILECYVSMQKQNNKIKRIKPSLGLAVTQDLKDSIRFMKARILCAKRSRVTSPSKP